MKNEETPRSIRFPKELWKAIDEEAKRCKRSSVKQLEVVLSTYYGIGEYDIDSNKLNMLRNFAPELDRKINEFYGDKEAASNYTSEQIEHGAIGEKGTLKEGTAESIADFLNKKGKKNIKKDE